MKRASGIIEIEASAATEVALVDGAPAKRVKLLPIGAITMRDARGPFLIADRAHAERIVAATQKWLGTADFNFDYGHAVQRDQAAIAAGWAKAASLAVEDDGIYADVEWTAAAAQKIAAREYRYLSPLFLAAKSGEVLQLKNAALVNIGAIDLPAIAAGLSGEENDMDLSAIAAALGLAPTATAEEVAAAAKTIKAKADAAPATSAIAVAAGLAADASVDTIAASVVALKAGQADPAKFVPIEQVTAITQQLGTLNKERAEREVAAAIQSGKLSVAMKPWGINLFTSNEQAWNDFVASAPVIIAAGAILGDRKPGEKATSLTADETAACAAIGMDHAEYLAAKNEEIA